MRAKITTFTQPCVLIFVPLNSPFKETRSSVLETGDADILVFWRFEVKMDYSVNMMSLIIFPGADIRIKNRKFKSTVPLMDTLY